VASCAAAAAALRTHGVWQVQLVHPPWFDDEFDKLGAAYFRSQGFDAVVTNAVGLPDDPPASTRSTSSSGWSTTSRRSSSPATGSVPLEPSRSWSCARVGSSLRPIRHSCGGSWRRRALGGTSPATVGCSGPALRRHEAAGSRWPMTYVAARRRHGLLVHGRWLRRQGPLIERLSMACHQVRRHRPEFCKPTKDPAMLAAARPAAALIEKPTS